jgi:hypothetical protein
MASQTLILKAGPCRQVVMLPGQVGGFSRTDSFGCTPPAGAHPARLRGGGSTTMSMATTAAQAKPVQLAMNQAGTAPWPFGAGSALAELLCLALPRRKSALPLLLTTR